MAEDHEEPPGDDWPGFLVLLICALAASVAGTVLVVGLTMARDYVREVIW